MGQSGKRRVIRGTNLSEFRLVLRAMLGKRVSTNETVAHDRASTYGVIVRSLMVAAQSPQLNFGRPAGQRNETFEENSCAIPLIAN